MCMIKEKYRKEVWSRNKPHMDNPCTTVDLEPCCELCKLWLSNEYLNDTRSIY